MTINDKLLPTQLPHPKNGRPINPQPKHYQVAQDIISGKPLGKSLRDAGYAESVCKNPSANINEIPAILACLRALMNEFEFTPTEKAKLIRQRLMRNVLLAKDADANRACELAGKDKDVRLFDADIQVNILNAYVPASVSEVFDSEVLGEEPA